MFANDLFLFAEASLDQVLRIKAALKLFCDASGQKVSDSKTLLYFSRNVDGGLRRRIQDASAFIVTSNIGRYLGVPMLHGRVTR